MKLLIVTQVIDTEHPILGFFHRWVSEFAQHCEQVHVICLQAGKHSLPANVTVHSLGKESGVGRLTYLWRFYQLIWQLRHEHDRVFVHMNQIYVILGAPFWRLWGKRVGLWYVHKQVTLSLRVAVGFTQVVFSSVPQSMRVKTAKAVFVGHGIDLEKYSLPRSSNQAVFTIVHIGRITQIKNIDLLIDAISQLPSGTNVQVLLYGEPVTQADALYKQQLQAQIAAKHLSTAVTFCGSVSNDDIPAALAKSDLSVNLTPTGGLDKAVIESGAAGVPVFTTNQSYIDSFGELAESYVLKGRDAAVLARQIERFIASTPEEKNAASIQFKKFSEQFSVAALVSTMLAKL